jgi:hypothetical protein
MRNAEKLSDARTDGSLTTGPKSTKDTTKDPEYKSLGGPAETPAYGRRDRRGESQKTNSQ